MAEQKVDKTIENIVKDEKSTVAMSKLKKTKVDIDINPMESKLKFAKDEVEKLIKSDISGYTDEEKKIFNDSISALNKTITRYESTRIQAVLVPLQYRDYQQIKTGITEAITYGREFNWDRSNVIQAIIREEHTLTIYFTLKKKDDITKRYYDSLEDIAKEDQDAIEQLHTIYFENFVLLDSERKNS